MPCAIGICRLTEHSMLSLDDCIEELTRHSRVLPVLDVDVRKREDITLLVDTSLAQLKTGIFGK